MYNSTLVCKLIVFNNELTQNLYIECNVKFHVYYNYIEKKIGNK